MNARQVFEAFMNLDENERANFFGQLAMWCDLHLADDEEPRYLVISTREYARLSRRSSAS